MYAICDFFHHPWEFIEGENYAGHPMTELRPDLFTTEPPTQPPNQKEAS